MHKNNQRGNRIIRILVMIPCLVMHCYYIYPKGMCPTLSYTANMKNIYFDECKEYATSESLWETFYDQWVMNNGIHKSKYHWADVSWSIKIKVKGGNNTIIYPLSERTQMPILANTTTVVMNTDIRRYTIPEIRDLILSSLYIGSTKYRIYPRKLKLPQISPFKK